VRIVVCGEAVVDLVQAGPRTWTSHPGGSPTNVAVGLARLGVPTAMLARLSGDAFGAMLRGHLRDAGVDLGLVVDAPQPSTLAAVSLDEAGVASYGFWTEGTADGQWTEAELAAPLPSGVAALHTGSMALELLPGAPRLVALLERLHGTLLLSYDPNVRLARAGDHARGLAAVERVVALADVVKVSSEDLAWLLPGLPVPEVLERWRALGPALVVATDGGEGATALGAAGLLHAPAEPVAVVDTVGAGDAFSAGLLAGLDDAGLLDRAALAAAGEDALRGALELAARVAGITCGRPGADPPTRAEALGAADR
jgi:fructokinase